MTIGTSDGETFESDFDFAFSHFTQGPGNKSTTKQEDISTTGQSPSPDNQSDIDNLVAAAGAIGAGDPVIGQMEATAQRSNPSEDLGTASGIASKKKDNRAGGMLTPEEIRDRDARIARSNLEHALKYPDIPGHRNIIRSLIPDSILEGDNDVTASDLRRSGGYFSRSEVYEQLKNEVIRGKGMNKDLNMPNLDIQSSPGIPPDTQAERDEILRNEYWIQRQRENAGKKPLQNMSMTDENPDPIASWGQYAMMKMKDIPSNPGVEAEKIAGGTAWARGQPRLEVKSMSEYYDKVPSDVRMKGNGISHPGFRFQVQDKEGNPVGKAYTNSRRAAGQVDKLDNEYGGYRYRKVMVPATDITDKEFEQMKKLGLIKPDAER